MEHNLVFSVSIILMVSNDRCLWFSSFGFCFDMKPCLDEFSTLGALCATLEDNVPFSLSE